MKKGFNTKILVLLVVLMLLVGMTVGGTLAWLMTRTDPLENTFTVGNIGISLKEHKLDIQTGEKILPEEWVSVTEGGISGIELLPGRTIYKDPTVVLEPGSEPCYVRVFMVVDYGEYMDAAYEGITAIEDWFDYDNNWEIFLALEDLKANDYGHVIEFRYTDGTGRHIPAVATALTEGETALDPVFHSITIPSYLTKNDNPYDDMYSSLSEAKLIFIAQAVQVREGMDPFEDVDYPDVTLSMTNGQMTLKQLIARNEGHLNP